MTKNNEIKMEKELAELFLALSNDDPDYIYKASMLEVKYNIDIIQVFDADFNVIGITVKNKEDGAIIFNCGHEFEENKRVDHKSKVKGVNQVKAFLTVLAEKCYKFNHLDFISKLSKLSEINTDIISMLLHNKDVYLDIHTTGTTLYDLKYDLIEVSYLDETIFCDVASGLIYKLD